DCIPNLACYHVSLLFGIPDDSMGRLSHVDTRMRCTARVTTIDQYIGAENRIDTVTTIFRRPLCSPHCLYIEECHAIGIFHLYGLTFCIPHRQVFDGKVHRIVYQQAVTATGLPGE